MRRWSRLRRPAAALLPLAPAVAVLTGHVSEGIALFVLLASVAAAAFVGGTAAGGFALAVGAAAFHVIVLRSPGAGWPRWSWPELAALLATGIGLVLLVQRFHRLTWEHGAAERRSEALAGQIALMAPVLDDSPIGFAIYDADLRYMYVNQAVADLQGRRIEDYTGRTLVEMFPDSDLDAVPQAIRELFATGVPQVGIHRHLRVRGEIRHVLVNRYAVRDPDGSTLGVAATYFDVTDRLRIADLEAETKRLREFEELVYKYEAAQRITGIGTWDMEITTGKRTWSKQMLAMFGLDQADLDAADLGDFTHPDDREKAFAAYRGLLDSGKGYQLAIRMLHADGRILHVIGTNQIVQDADGRPLRLWGTVQDVTDRLALEAAHAEAIHEAEVARAELEIEHAALKMVQQAMLPAEVATVPGVEVAVAYRPMENVADVGGDWYDAFELPDGRLAFAIGDVAGHDLRAATVMGQVRNALRAYAIEDPRPGHVLRRTNALLLALPDPELVTAVFGVFDPRQHLLTYARAGHPYPVVSSAGRAVVRTEPFGVLLGALPTEQPYPELTLGLAEGDTVLFYTDGLVERRGGDTVRATERLRALVEEVPAEAGAEAVVREVTGSMIEACRSEDDICLLALHRPVQVRRPRDAAEVPATSAA